MFTPPLSSWLNGSTHTPSSGSVPKAYINWVFLDEQFNTVTTNGLSGATAVGGNNVLKSIHNTVNISKNGYLYVYCSDESDINVFFDNLQVIQTHGPLIEETHYYPFGLTMAGISSQALNFGTPENNKLYNKGSELQHHEFSDGSGLELYSTNFRSLDPQLGRWWQIDPKPDMAMSPYSAMNDNPILHNDPLGDSTDVHRNKDGTYTVVGGEVNDNKNIYVVDDQGKATEETIGTSLTTNSFFNKKGKAVIGATINLSDNSGRKFLNKMKNPFFKGLGMFYYMHYAKGGYKYDFKVKDIQQAPIGTIDQQYEYRGMNVNGTMGITSGNGSPVIASARDIGNVAAGYVAGENGFTWNEARTYGFDKLQSEQEGHTATEIATTQLAQRVGFEIGKQTYENETIDIK